jgi:hypothetical protein
LKAAAPAASQSRQAGRGEQSDPGRPSKTCHSEVTGLTAGENGIFAASSQAREILFEAMIIFRIRITLRFVAYLALAKNA